MVTRIFIVLFMIYGCGKKVNLTPNQLENADLLTNSNASQYQKSGTFDSKNQTMLYNGTSYKVSKFSSQSSFDFINSLPANSQVAVVFTGGIKGDEIVFENMKKR